MITKLFEIRDRGTFIPVMATKMVPSTVYDADLVPEEHVVEGWLLRRAGFGPDSDWVILCRLECSGLDRNATYDPYAWSGRTYPVAHRYIAEHFDGLESGAVIDVEFILGETTEPKQSERSLS